MRIPVRIEDDDGVGSLQIESESTGAGREHEDEMVTFRGVEHSQQFAALVRFGTSIETQIFPF